ncbi:MAG: efflux RND transporter periplasmic adaptor subunit [Bacteroidetes bacterium]|jgi:RND family efflux transporter MFP subunit|nr:efflux RND transporter periplasmic adaptor subunit [Bacteroidota bacterium]
MKYLNLFAIATLIIMGCASKPESDLDKKRTELVDAEKALDSIQNVIAGIKEEITELDTTARTKTFPVKVKEIATGAFQNPFQIQGLVESDQNVLISPEVPGNVVSVLVKEGQRVSKGQVIATLDGSIAGSQISELENALSLAKINFEKQERLWNKKIGSEMQYLQAKNQYENLEKSLNTARAQLGKYTLRSPIYGTVDEIMANPGELVGGMTSGPVARIVNLKDIKIKANVSERYIGQIKKGQSVQLNFPSLGLEMTETVSAVSNVIDVNNRTFVVYVKPSKNLDKLKPNLLTLITAYDYVDKEAISIPTKLVRTDGEKAFVFVVKTQGQKKIVEKRFIEIQKQFPSQTLIKSGLSEGDLLITEGVASVIVGDELKIIEPKTED